MPTPPANTPLVPMPVADWANIDPAKKKQMLVPFHQSIVYGATQKVMECLSQSVQLLVKNGGNPTQALVIVAQVNDPALPFSAMPAKVRKRLEKKIGDVAYIVIPFERDKWTGGAGAPHWDNKHPYKNVMLELCNEPELGKLWCVVFAGGGATAFQLGEHSDAAPGMEGVTMAEDAGVVAGDDAEDEVTDTASDVVPTEGAPRVDPFEH